MTSLLAKSKQIIGAQFQTLFSTIFLLFDVPQYSGRFDYIKDIRPAIYFNNQISLRIIFKSVMHGQCEAGHTVTFPVAEHRCPATSTKLYCLVTDAHVCEQLARGRYLTAKRQEVELATSRVANQCLNHDTISVAYYNEASNSLGDPVRSFARFRRDLKIYQFTSVRSTLKPVRIATTKLKLY